MVESGASLPPVAPSVQPGSSVRWYWFAGLLLLLMGAAGGAWALSEFRQWNPARSVQQAAMIPSGNGVAATAKTAPQALALPAQGPVQAQAQVQAMPTPQELVARLIALEERVAQLNLAAANMTGNAARAESMMIAFAARRALDHGAALGPLEGQLKLYFGAAQPNAVRTLIETARTPVTLEHLLSAFDRIAPELTGGPGAKSGRWNSFRREMGELFTLRRADQPSIRMEQRLARARSLLVAGSVDAAAREVAQLPTTDAAAAWLAEARRYHEARRALDLIETGAILGARDPAVEAATQRLPEQY